MEEVKKKKPRIKKWGENGFVGKIQYGCYEYTIRFVPEKAVAKYASLYPDTKAYGVIHCDEQTILISSDLTEQTKKLSLMHELTHMVFLNNNVGLSEDTLNIQKEELVDNVAARMFELMKRNPELMRWLLK